MTRTLAIPTSLLVAALAMGAAVPADAQGFPRLALHGRMYGNGFPLTLGGTRDGPLNNPTLDAYARYQELTLPPSPITEYRPDITQALRQRRPDIRLMAYVMGSYIWEGPDSPDSLVDFATRYRQLVRNLDGYLYNLVGTHYGAGTVNLAKRDGTGRFVVAEALVDLWVDAVYRSGLWDGIFFDGPCNSILWTQTPREAIDYVRAGYPSLEAFDAAWLAATDTLASRMRRKVDPDFRLVGNCGQGTKYDTFNGWMRENFPFQDGGTWYDNMFAEPGGYFTDERHFRPPVDNYIFTTASFPADPYSSNALRRTRLGLGSASLGDGFGIIGPGDLDALSYPYYHWWFDEYAVDLATGRADSSMSHIGWLGQALGPAYQMIWSNPNTDAVANPGFEQDLSGWSFWAGTPAQIARDTTAGARGTGSARISAPTRALADFGVTLSSVGQLPVVAGQLYSATFWARASHPCRFTVAAGVSGAGGVAYRTVDVDTVWRQYQVGLVPYAALGAQLEFYLGFIEGDVWLDDVHFQPGSSSFYRRDFENGTVLVNPATEALTADLGRPFQRIQGFRDPVTNDGSTVTRITVPAGDARFLIGQDRVPPDAIRDLRVVPR